jgi:hypothetical protein
VCHRAGGIVVLSSHALTGGGDRDLARWFSRAAARPVNTTRQLTVGFRPAAAVDAQLPDTPAGKPSIKL